MTRYFSLGSIKHVISRPQQAVLGGARSGNNVTIDKLARVSVQRAKMLSK